MIWVALLGCRQTLVAEADPHKAPTRWNATLGQVVTREGLVDYDLLETKRDALDGYVAWLARGETFERAKLKADHHAHWLNAYNALVLFQVLERGRPRSVLDVDGWLPGEGSGFFVETQFEVGPYFVSLSEIEHEHIRMRELNWRDHAAMNCASMGCPPLRGELYSKDKLREQLTDQTERWLRDRVRGARIEDEVLVLSPLFDWYAWDFAFTTSGRDVCSLVAENVDNPMRSRLLELAEEGCPHRFDDFDWRLNDAGDRTQ